MVPAPEVEHEVRMCVREKRSWHEDKWARRIAEADAEGAPATFRVDWLLGWWRANRPSSETLAQIALTIATGGDGSKELDFVWMRGSRVLALCAKNEGSDARILAADHVEVHDVTSFTPLVNALRRTCEGLNPIREGGKVHLAAELEAFEAETGIRLEFPIDAVRAAIAPPRRLEWALVEGSTVRQGRALDDRARAVIDDFLGREVVLPEDDADIVWVLELSRTAPLIHTRADDTRLTFFANVGTGNVLRFDVLFFPGEARMPVQRIAGIGLAPFTLDGGDVRLVWQRSVHEALAGFVPPALARRRKIAAAAAARVDGNDDDDYDDDGGRAGWPSTTGNPSGGGRDNA